MKLLEDGAWDQVVHETLDSSLYSNSEGNKSGNNPKLKLFKFPIRRVRYVKFELLSHYGSAGGGLSYFGLNYAGIN